MATEASLPSGHFVISVFGGDWAETETTESMQTRNLPYLMKDQLPFNSWSSVTSIAACLRAARTRTGYTPALCAAPDTPSRRRTLPDSAARDSGGDSHS